MILKRDVTGFSLLGILVVFALLGANGIAIASPCGEGCGISVVSDPMSVLMGLCVPIFVTLHRRRITKPLGDRIVRIWRRLAAFFVDHGIVVFSIVSIDALVLVSVEYFETGILAWSFETSPSSITNVVGFFTIAFSIVSYAGYFSWMKRRGLPTIGQYICGFVIVRDPDRPKSPWVYGSITALVALCSIHIWGWFFSLNEPKDGTYWWERAAGTRAKTFF